MDPHCQYGFRKAMRPVGSKLEAWRALSNSATLKFIDYNVAMTFILIIIIIIIHITKLSLFLTFCRGTSFLLTWLDLCLRFALKSTELCRVPLHCFCHAMLFITLCCRALSVRLSLWRLSRSYILSKRLNIF